MPDSTTQGPNPSGLCLCGCGGTTPIAARSSTRLGHVKGQPTRYINGHSWRGKTRKSGPEYVEQERGYSTPCWVWVRGKKSSGYGYLTEQSGDERRAHVAYWERANGPVPPGCELDHLCRNRLCLRPSHLEAVPHSKNCRRGLGARLAESDIPEIRSRLASGESQSSIGNRFGVTQGCISSILRGRTWVGVAD